MFPHVHRLKAWPRWPVLEVGVWEVARDRRGQKGEFPTPRMGLRSSHEEGEPGDVSPEHTPRKGYVRGEASDPTTRPSSRTSGLQIRAK